ncbi:MAG: hypothetical protein RIS02_1595 [Pseudomonadota bacterium]
MGLDGKNIMAVTNISVQICKLLMGIIEQYEANIANRVLLSELGDEGAKFLLKENLLPQISAQHLGKFRKPFVVFCAADALLSF